MLSVHDVQQSGVEQFFVLLSNGVQHISPFVASLLRSANSFGDLAPVVVSPDRLAPTPVVDALPVSYYPSTRLHLVDTAINGTTCLAWSKGSTDKSARIAVLSGQGLPTPPQTDDRLVHLVKDTRNDPAAVEPIRSMSVKARRIWSWPPMPTPSRSAAIRCGGSPTTSEH